MDLPSRRPNAVKAHYVVGPAILAEGSEAIAASVSIAIEKERGNTSRALASYIAAVAFGAIAAGLIVFAPAERDIPALVGAVAFLVVAAGLAGFTYLKASNTNVTVRNQ